MSKMLSDGFIFRYRPRETPPPGVTPLPRDNERPKGTPRAADRLLAERWFFFARARHPQNLYYQAVS